MKSIELFWSKVSRLITHFKEKGIDIQKRLIDRKTKRQKIPSSRQTKIQRDKKTE